MLATYHVEINKGNFFEFISLVIKNTINWNDGPKIGLLNGDYYEVFNTPKDYFLYVVIFRLPYYFTILIIISYLLFLLKKINLNNEVKSHHQKFFLINLVAFFQFV